MKAKELSVKIPFSKENVQAVIDTYRRVLKEENRPIKDPSEKWVRRFLRDRYYPETMDHDGTFLDDLYEWVSDFIADED